MPSTRVHRTGTDSDFLSRTASTKDLDRSWLRRNPDEPAQQLVDHLVNRIGPGRLVEAALTVGSQEEIDRLADRIAALLPSSDPAIEAIGPVFETSDLEEWLGVSRQAIHQRARRHSLLAIKTSDGHTVYPEWQFDAHGHVLPGVGDALRVLAQGGMDDLTNALWFAGPVSELRGLSAVEWLSERRPSQPVVVAAQHTAARWRE